MRTQAQAAPALSPVVAVDAWAAMAGVVELTLKDSAQAIAIDSEAWKLYSKEPRAAALLVHHTRLLLQGGRPSDVQALVDQNWAPLTQAPPTYSRTIFWHYLLALKAQDKGAAVIPFLRKVLLQIPAYLDEDKKSTGGWVYHRLVQELLAQGRSREARAWVKLRWMECAFDPSEMKAAHALLVQTGLSLTVATPIAAKPIGETSTAAKPNTTKPTAGPSAPEKPLSEVEPVGWNTQALPELLRPLASAKGDLLHEQSTHRRISALILAREWDRAMSEAQTLWTDMPLSPSGVKEVARVFKAHDLNLDRANAFVRWSAKREGTNPVDSFLKEVQDKTKTVPVLPVTLASTSTTPKISSPPATGEVTPTTIPEVALESVSNSGEKTEETLGNLLYRVTTPELFSPSADTGALRKALLSLMAAQGSKPLSQALQDGNTRQWTAYLCAAAGEARAVPLLEAMLQEIPTPAGSEAQATKAMYLLMRLSAYYEKKGDLTQAAQTQLRGQKYAQGFRMPTAPFTGPVPVAGMMANRQLEAARLYQRAGNVEQAKQAYAQVAKYGYGWATGMALYDQAMVLIEQGQQDEARRLLQQPVEGVYADQVKVGLLAGLGASYYRSGEFELAKRYNQQTIDSYKALVNPLKGENLEYLTDMAKQRLEWGEKWKQAPLLATPDSLTFMVTPEATAPQRLSLYALNEVPLTVTCDDPHIQLGTMSKGWRDDWGYFRKIDVKVLGPKGNSQRDFTATLLVRSTSFPAFSLRVPVRVEGTKSTTPANLKAPS